MHIPHAPPLGDHCWIDSVNTKKAQLSKSVGLKSSPLFITLDLLIPKSWEFSCPIHHSTWHWIQGLGGSWRPQHLCHSNALQLSYFFANSGYINWCKNKTLFGDVAGSKIKYSTQRALNTITKDFWWNLETSIASPSAWLEDKGVKPCNRTSHMFTAKINQLSNLISHSHIH